MIDFKCPQCGRDLHAKESAAGKKCKCPQCDNLLRVPLATAEQVPTTIPTPPNVPNAVRGQAETPANPFADFQPQGVVDVPTGEWEPTAPTAPGTMKLDRWLSSLKMKAVGIAVMVSSVLPPIIGWYRDARGIEWGVAGFAMIPIGLVIYLFGDFLKVRLIQSQTQPPPLPFSTSHQPVLMPLGLSLMGLGCCLTLLTPVILFVGFLCIGMLSGGTTERDSRTRDGRVVASPVITRDGQRSVSAPPQRHSVPISIPDVVECTIIDEHINRDIRRTLDVRLNKKVSEDVLKTVAHELKKSDSNTYKRTFIGIYLPDMQVNSGFWATADFNPDLQIQIIGLTLDQEDSLKHSPVESTRDTIGAWLQDREPAPGKITIFTQNESLWMEKTYTDGNTGKYQMVEMPSDEGRKFMKANRARPENDYYLIDNRGNLQVWSRDIDGPHVLVVTAAKIE